NSTDVIETLMQIHARHLKEMRNVNPTLIHDLQKYHPLIHKKIGERQKENLYRFMPLIKKGVEQGLIRGNINWEIMLWLLKSQFKAVMSDENDVSDKYSTEEFCRTIIFNFLRGIATPLGSEKMDAIIEQLNTQTKNENIETAIYPSHAGGGG
ncbi:MAG: hypothetical protein LBP83_00445, partial [Dysgonamonadaceae bacterium]|nr:hypothetical protein [Dysgonamonadaceae bacterium]